MFGASGLYVQLHSQADVNHCELPKVYWNMKSGKLLRWYLWSCFLVLMAELIAQQESRKAEDGAGELMGAGRY